MLEWFCDMLSEFLFSGGVYISGTEYNSKLKFSMQTHLNTIFKYCHASVILDNIRETGEEWATTYILCSMRLFSKPIRFAIGLS